MGWIRVLEKKLIPDWGKKAPNPISGSATLQHGQLLELNLSNKVVGTSCK